MILNLGGINLKLGFSTNGFHRYIHRRKKTPEKVLEFTVFFIIFLLFVGLIYQFIATEMDKGKFKMKGKLVSVGSYRIFTNTSGSGAYSIVFINDMNTPMEQWNRVKEEIQGDYRVFSYDRNGYGWSDSSGEEVDMKRSVTELKTALSRSGVYSPYILVGHGYGGLIATEFANKYSENVAGVVLIDSLMEEEIKSEEFQKSIKKQVSKAGVGRFFSYFGASRLGYTTNILKNDEAFLKNLSDSEKELFLSQRVTSKHSTAYYRELQILKDYEGKIQEENTLGNIFLHILTPEKKYNDEEMDKQYINKQSNLEKLSTRSEQAIVEDTSSYIQVDRPDAVIKAINKIAKESNKEKK